MLNQEKPLIKRKTIGEQVQRLTAMSSWLFTPAMAAFDSETWEFGFHRISQSGPHGSREAKAGNDLRRRRGLRARGLGQDR